MFKYKIFFKIEYKTAFEEFLVIVGNTNDLGNWNVEKGLKLKWSKGDFWDEKILMKHDCKTNCEYKYVLCYKDNLSQAIIAIRWEEGPNRLITFQNIRKLVFSINDRWGFRKICFRTPNTLEKSTEVLKIKGDIPQLGSLNHSVHEMKLVYKKSKNSDVKQYFWEIEVAIDPMEKKINYLYLVYDKESLEISYERNKERIVVLDSFSVIFCNRKNNTFKIYDSPLQTKFNFSEINENIILGPCPLNYEEIDLLYKKGVKGILNLQRDEDMVRFGVDWDYMKEIYWSKDMHPVNYKIKDKLPDQIGQKILIAAEILNGMIEKFGKTYVHCSYGKIRSPYTVMAYICLYNQMPLDKAIDTIKLKRPLALANKSMLIEVMKFKKQIHHLCVYV